MRRLLIALVIASLFMISASVLHIISFTYAAGVATGLLLGGAIWIRARRRD